MIPSKLKLKNFMCYRGTTETLDFDQFDVACITGDNGNGKSALLEAITWVIWGKTKVLVSKDLITKGVAFHHSGVYHIFKEVIAESSN